MTADTDQPTLAVSQMRRARVHAALRSIEEGTRLDDLTDDEIDMIIDAARDHRTNFERPAGDLREAAQRVVDDYPAAAGACASIEGGDGKPGWGSIRRLAEALAAHSPAPMAGEVEDLRRTRDALEYAIERMATLTPGRANASDAQDLHCAIRAIGFSALEKSPGYNERPGLVNTDPDAAHPSTQEGADCG